jgi:RNA polymerase sigma factor (sigma-70 family)
MAVRIMHNLFVSPRCRAKVRRQNSFPIDVEATTAPIREHEDNALRWQDVVRAFNTMPEDQRVVLLLVSIEKFSYDEVARILRIPVGTVMSRLTRARERLRSLMQAR